MTFNNQQLSQSNISVTCDFIFLVILLEKEHSSPHRCIKYNSPSKYWKLSDYSMSDKWTINTLKVMSQFGKKANCLGVKEDSYLDFVVVDNFIFPILYNQIYLGNIFFRTY